MGQSHQITSHRWGSYLNSFRDFFWDTLEKLAFRDQLTINQTITKLYHESLDADHDISNFTSFLRVCCSRYLSLIADGELSREYSTSLDDINAPNIILKERQRRIHRKKRFVLSNNKSSVIQLINQK